MEIISTEILMLKDRIEYQKKELSRLESLLNIPEYRIEGLQTSIKDWTKQAVDLNLSLVYWKKFEMKDFRNILLNTKHIMNNEKKLIELLKRQIIENPEDISNFYECNNSSVSLSLVLNTFQIPFQVIQSLYPLNGYSFLQPRILYDTLIFYGIFDDFQSRADLAFIQEMLLFKKIPFVDHMNECPVCYCNNVPEFINLIREHEKDINTDILHRYSITGHRFLQITRSDCIKLFSVSREEVEPLMQLVHYFHKLHLENLNE